jgi:hypothetical protein
MSMPRVEQLLAEREEAVANLTELDFEQFRKMIRCYRRGGLPASSIPNGSRGSGPPEGPMPDSVDRQLRRAEIDLYRGLGQVLKASRSMVQAYRSVVLAYSEEQIPMFACKNPKCEKTHERENGECGRCRKWRHDHGLAYPLQRETRITTV